MVETQRDVWTRSRRVHQIMRRKPITLQPDADLTEAIQLFLAHPIS
jgi:acetoin utilization protein AcuB